MTDIYSASTGGTLLGSGGTSGSSTRQMETLARNARLIAQQFPQFASDPNSLLRMAGLDMTQSDLADQTTQLAAARTADINRGQLEAFPEAAQRVLWERMSPAEQQAYGQLGYQPPQTPHVKSSIPGADLLGDVWKPLGTAYSDVVGAGEDVVKGGLRAFQEIGQIPTEMYRAIRQQPEWIQTLAGIAAAGFAVAATAATGGADIPALGGLLGGTEGLGLGGTAFGALTTGYVAAGITAGTQGDPGYWGRTFRWGDDGEGVFQQGALGRATDHLQDDGSILDLAQKLSLAPQKMEGDTSPTARLLRVFASRRDATSDTARLGAVEELAARSGAQIGSPEYQQAYSALEALSREPRFLEALAELESAKISPGRDLAHLFGLNPSDGLGTILSGAGDATFQFIADPILAAGRINETSRALRFGVRSDMLGEDFASLGTRIDTLATKAPVQKAWDVIADRMAANDPAGLIRQMPSSADLVPAMQRWEAGKQAALGADETFRWDRGAVQDFFKDQAGWKTLASGRAMGSTPDHLIMVPHLTATQSAALRARSDVMSVLRRLDDDNIAFRVQLPEALAPEYDTAAQMANRAEPQMNWSSGLAYRVLHGVPVLRWGSEGAGTLLTTITTKLPASGAVDLSLEHAGGARDIMALTDLGRVMGVPSAVRDEWANAIITAPSIAARRAAVRSWYDTLFTKVGLTNTAEGQEIAQKFLQHQDKAYALGRNVGTWLGDSADFIAIPNLREMRRALRDHTIVNKLLNLTDSDYIDKAMTKIWKPSVLLRIGFIPRAAGDELLNWLGRDGMYGFIAPRLAKAVEDPNQDLVGHVRWLAALNKRFFDAGSAGLGRFGVQTSDYSATMLHGYSDVVRSVYRNGLLRGTLDGDGVGQRFLRGLLAPEGTVRSLLFNGVPKDYLDHAAKYFASPIIQEALMREAGALRHSPVADVARLDPYSDASLYTGDAWNNLEMAQQHRLRSTWEQVNPTSSHYDYDAYRNQLRVGSTDGLWRDNRVLDAELRHVDPYVQRALISSTITDPDIANLANIAQGLDPAVARPLLAGLAKDDVHFVRTALDSIPRTTPEGEWLATIGRDTLDSGHMRDLWVAALDDPAAPLAVKTIARTALHLSDRGNLAARGWLAAYLDRANEGHVIDLARDWVEPQRDYHLGEALRRQLEDPDRMAKFQKMEDSYVTAISGQRVARPLVDGTQRGYLPAPTVGGVETLDRIAKGDAATVEHLNATANKRAADHIKRIASEWDEYAPHLVNIAGGGLHRPIWWAFRDPIDARNVTRTLNELAGVDRPDIVSDLAEINLPRTLDNVPWVRNVWQGGDAARLSPEQIGAANLVHAKEPIVEVNGQMLPGVGMHQAVAEHVDKKVAAYKEWFHSRVDQRYDPIESDPLVARSVQPRDPLKDPSLPDDEVWWMNDRPVTVEQIDRMVPDDNPMVEVGPDHLAIDHSLVSEDYHRGLRYVRGNAVEQTQPLTPAQAFKAPRRFRLDGNETFDGDAEKFLAKRPMPVVGDVPNPKGGTLERVGLREARGRDELFAGKLRSQPWDGTVLVAKTTPEEVDRLIAEGRFERVVGAYVMDDPAGAITARLRAAGVDTKTVIPTKGAPASLTADRVPVRWDWTVQRPAVVNNRVHLPYTAQDGFRYAVQPPEGVSTELFRAAIGDRLEEYVKNRTIAAHLLGRPDLDTIAESTPDVEDVVASWMDLPWGKNLAARTDIAIRESPGSVEIARALGNHGVDPDQLHAWMDDNGEVATYSEFLARVHAAHMTGTPWDEATATALTNIGYPIGAHADRAAVSRFLWESAGPQALQSRWERRLGTLQDEAGRPAFLPSQGDMRFIPKADRPRNVVRPVIVFRPPVGGFDKAVQWGFGKVIGPAIDRIVREPMALHNFVMAYRDAGARLAWLRAPELFAEGTGGASVRDATVRQPWQAEQRGLVDALSSGDMSTEAARRGLALSDGEAWFDRYGKPTPWLRDNVEALREHTASDAGLGPLVENIDSHTSSVEQLAGGEGKFHGMARNMLDGSQGRNLPTGAAAGRLRSDLVAAGALQGDEPLALGIARLRAEPERWQGLLGDHPLTEWTTQPPATTAEAMDELMAAHRAGTTPAWVGRDLTPAERRTVAQAVANVDTVDRTATKLAIDRAIADTTPFIHRTDARSQWAEYGRNVFPFWNAEDMFLRRTAKTVLQHPEAIRKAQILYSGLKSGGVITQDQNGNDVFTYPGSAVLAEAVGKIPWLSDHVPLATAMSASVNYLLPGLDRFGLPSVSPLISIPMDQVASIFPELRPINATLAGDYTGRGIIRAIVPPGVMRFYDALMSNDSDQKMASAMMTAMQVLEANGHGLPDGADAYQTEHFIDRVRNTARIILLTQAITGFVAPAAPRAQVVGSGQPGQQGSAFDWRALTGIDTPSAALNDEFQKMVRNEGIEEGTTSFLARYPDATPDDLFNSNVVYRIGTTFSPSGAPISPTKAAADFLTSNANWVKHNPSAAAWFIPQPETREQADQVDPNVWAQQVAAGLRVHKSPQDMVTDLKYASAAETYFDVTKQMQSAIDQATGRSDRNELTLRKDLWVTAFLATHPIFAQELQSGDGQQKRTTVLQGLRNAFLDPSSPRTDQTDAMQQMVTNLDQYQYQKAQLTGLRSQRSVKERQALNDQFSQWAESWVMDHPYLRTFYLSIIAPEI